MNTYTRGLEREKALEFKDYFTKDYFSYNQLWSFVEQIHHIINLQPHRMIEIGIGNGFVSTFLKRAGFEVTTIDVNPKLKPDIVMPVQEIRDYFKNRNNFDLISCCEVLEHIPFNQFENIIKDFSEISSQLFLTLPQYNRFYGFGAYISLPLYPRWASVWLRIKKTKKLTAQHFWEINYSKETKLKNIILIIKKYFPQVKAGLFKG